MQMQSRVTTPVFGLKRRPFMDHISPVKRARCIGNLAISVSSSLMQKGAYRGRCKYKSGRCPHERTLKYNGEIHTLCEDHRIRHNKNQRKSDSKRRQSKKNSSNPVTIATGFNETNTVQSESKEEFVGVKSYTNTLVAQLDDAYSMANVSKPLKILVPDVKVDAFDSASISPVSSYSTDITDLDIDPDLDLSDIDVMDDSLLAMKDWLDDDIDALYTILGIGNH